MGRDCKIVMLKVLHQIKMQDLCKTFFESENGLKSGLFIYSLTNLHVLHIYLHMRARNLKK
nr:MAG TPA: hypothetical protein [Caudoviricetes sp.]